MSQLFAGVVTQEDGFDTLWRVAVAAADYMHAARKEPPWRVIVLEDCGEMLAVDARREVGQALSRMLNACDGLIGRGLRFLVLVTTNEPVSKLHPAVARPGRCAANIEFGGFSADQAEEWLDAHGHLNSHAGACQLADLYAITEGFADPRQHAGIGFAA